MDSTTSTPKKRKATTRQDGEMEKLAVGFISYSETGGTCRRRGCKNDAPEARVGGSVLRLPCANHAAEQEAEWAEEERLMLSASYLADSGLTPRQREFTFESYESVCGDEEGLAALAVARRWTQAYLDGASVGNLLLHGPIGVGKSGLAASVVRAICESGRAARIVNFKALLDAMKECFDRHDPTRLALGVNRVPVLVLDDVGAERPTEWARDELLGIVDYRYERGLATVYISNFAPADLARRLGRDDLVVGQRIVSRMREGATIFEFAGGDRRKASPGSPGPSD